MHSYMSRDEERSIPHSVKDTRTIGSAYDLYLQSVVNILILENVWSLPRFVFFSSDSSSVGVANAFCAV